VWKAEFMVGKGMCFADDLAMQRLLLATAFALIGLTYAAADAAAQTAPLALSRPAGLLRVPPTAQLERALVPGRQNSAPSRRGVGRAILGGAVGAVGGLFTGGYLGAKIEGNSCHCDDQGLTGALIGAPIGTIAGAVLGARYLF